jgi:glycosyltransferase involved in cell wall biosynthesis
MCDLTKNSPAKEHFIGLGNGLTPFFDKIESFTHVNGKEFSINDSDISFKNDVLHVPLNHKKRYHRMIALIAYNCSVPIYILYKLITKRHSHKVIYSRHMPADMVNILISKLFNVKYIVEINGDVTTDRELTNKNKFITRFLAFIQKFVIKNSDFVVVPTSNLKSILSETHCLLENKVIHIENGFSLERFDEIDGARLFKKEGKVIIGFGGVFSIWQGLDLILECCDFLDDDVLDKIKFVLVGDGPEFNKIKNKVEDFNLSEYFTFTGFVNQSDYISSVKKFDICIAPYIKKRNDKWGVSPIKIHSYLACKKPIITSNISGARELITNSNAGYLFEPDDAEDLARKLTFAVNNLREATQKGLDGYIYLSENLTWNKLAEEFYEKIK